MSLLKDGKPLDALQVFSALLKQQNEAQAAQQGSGPTAGTPSGPSDAASIAASLLLLCCAKLELPPQADAVSALSVARSGNYDGRSSGSSGSGISKQAAAFCEALGHLTAALSLTAPPSSSTPPAPGGFKLPGVKSPLGGSRPAPAPRPQARPVGNPKARRVGEALAFLMHPLASYGALPACMITDALTVVRDHAPAAMAPGAAAVAASGGGDGAAGRAGARSAKQREFEERAGGSAALTELMKLTGLGAVKELMLNLKDEVGGWQFTNIWSNCGVSSLQCSIVREI